LRILEPDRPAASADSFVAAVMTRVEAQAPATAIDPLIGLWLFGRSILITAVAIVVIAVARINSDRTARHAPITVAEAIGIPADLRQMLSRVDGER
jgi:hypothetical protein